MIVRAGPQLTKEELEKKMALVMSQFPHAKIVPIGDGVKIVGISQQEEEKISSIIEGEGICINEPAPQNAVVQQSPKVLSQESVSTGENEFALVAKKFFAHIAQEKTSLAEKAMQEKIEEIFAKVEERNMFWTNSWNDFTRQLAGIEKDFIGLTTILESLRQKLDLMGAAWEDERNKRNGEAEANLADHKKVAESVAKTIQYLRELPIPK